MQKQQHYVPKCYSKNFTNGDGYIYMRDMWNDTIFPSKPINALKQSRLYTQPVHAEKRFDNALENLFSSTVESDWTPLVKVIDQRKPLNREEWGQLIQFMSSMRVRVPNTIKAVLWAVKDRVILEANKFPVEGICLELFKKKNPEFQGMPLFEDLVTTGLVNVPIDPHRSLLSFEKLIKNNKAILAINGNPTFIHNLTKTPFISSDNPFISHTHVRKLKKIRPYSYDHNLNTEIIFPITSKIVLLMNPSKVNEKQYFNITKEETVREINNKISLYSDRYIFGNSASLIRSIPNFGDICPVPSSGKSRVGPNGVVHELILEFGSPIKGRNKWKYDFEA